MKVNGMDGNLKSGLAQAFQQVPVPLLARNRVHDKSDVTRPAATVEQRQATISHQSSTSASDTIKNERFALEKDKIIEDLMQRNRDLEQFANVISHNLRSPVANIIGITDLLEEEFDALPEQASLLESLARAAKALDVVIKDLNYILQTKKEISEQKTNVDFEQILITIRLSIQQLIDQNEAAFISDFSAVAGISSIRSYVYSILYNLISNSIKFKRAGVPPLITIHTEKLPNGVLLVCKDNGLGIDLAKKRSELFGLYKRFHPHTEGKGMGLFLVKTQIEVLGGSIEVNSIVDEGTEMRLFFKQTEN